MRDFYVGLEYYNACSVLVSNPRIRTRAVPIQLDRSWLDPSVLACDRRVLLSQLEPPVSPANMYACLIPDLIFAVLYGQDTPTTCAG